MTSYPLKSLTVERKCWSDRSWVIMLTAKPQPEQPVDFQDNKQLRIRIG
jgi:hypothetical protein